VANAEPGAGCLRIRLKVLVQKGSASFGILRAGGGAFICESRVDADPAWQVIDLHAPQFEAFGAFVIRNASADVESILMWTAPAISALQRTHYLVYSNGKVGTQTIEKVLRDIIKPGDVVHRDHVLSRFGLDRVERLASKDSRDAFHGQDGALQQARVARNTVSAIEAEPSSQVWILTGVRDPLELMVASFFQNLDTQCPGLTYDPDRIDEELGRVTTAFQAWTAVSASDGVSDPSQREGASPKIAWLHDGARIETPVEAWSFALSVPITVPDDVRAAPGRVRLSTTKVTGRLGLGLLDTTTNAWVARAFSEADGEFEIRFQADHPPLALVIHNASTTGMRSTGTVSDASLEVDADGQPWIGRVNLRTGIVHGPLEWAASDSGLFWFDREFRPFTGIDIFSHPLGDKPFITFRDGRYDVLLYRFESLRGALPDMIGALGLIPPASIQATNVGVEKSSGALYRAFRQAFAPDEAFLRRIYETPHGRFFYPRPVTDSH